MKKFLIIIVILIVIVVGVLIFGISKLGPIIQSAVNTYGPEITRTEVRLGDVDVSLFSGQARLSDFYLGNPKGFHSSQAVRLGSVMVDVNEKSLAGDTIIIDKIEIVGPEITYEKKLKTDNFQTILKNVKEATGQDRPSQKAAAAPEEKSGGKNILIKDFVLKGGKVTLTESILKGRTLSVPLRDIHLKNVGNKGMGAPPAETVAEILAVLYREITSPAITDALTQELKKLGVSLEGDLKNLEGDLKKKIGEETSKAGDTLKKELESSGLGTKEELDNVQNQIKGLLGK